MANHAKLSPSSAVRWTTCPGSVVLSEGLPDTSSEYADEGTAAHFLASFCLKHGEDAAGSIGFSIYLLKDADEHFESFAAHHLSEAAKYTLLNTFVVDEDMAEHVQVYLDYVRDVVKSTGGTLFVEQAVPLEHMTGEVDAEGTSDAIIVCDTEIIIIDLKYGQGQEVDATENKQLLMYASGAVYSFDLLGEFKTIRVAISQPRITRQPSEWSCDMWYLYKFEAEIQAAASRVDAAINRDPNAVLGLTPSEKGCKWCKAKATCPALANFVCDTVGAEFDDLVLMDKVPVGGDTPAQMGVKMACLDMIEGWCAAYRGHVDGALHQGVRVPGWKLVKGKMGNRKWSSEEEAEALMKSMRMKVDEMYDFKVISPTTAEKVLKDNPKKWAKAQALITQAEGKASVAPESDKRPALVVTPAADEYDDLS